MFLITIVKQTKVLICILHTVCHYKNYYCYYYFREEAFTRGKLGDGTKEKMEKHVLEEKETQEEGTCLIKGEPA